MLQRAALFVLVSSLSFAQQLASPPELTVEKIFAEGGITGRQPETVDWSPDGKKITYVLRDNSGEHGQLWFVDVATGVPAVLVTEERLDSLLKPVSAIKSEREKERRERYRVAGYHWAPDSRHILFDSNGQLWLYDTASKTGVPVTSAPEPVEDPKSSPDGDHISYIRNHNLFIHATRGVREDQLTREHDPEILDGEVDWVYAEELDARSNYFWSPDSKRIALLQMNEKPVPTYPLTDLTEVHPGVDAQKYPQAGDPNPLVRLGVVRVGGFHGLTISASSGDVHWFTLPEQETHDENLIPAAVGSESDIYIPRFGWVNNHVLYAVAMNRLQNEEKLYFIDADSGRSRLMLDEKSDTWIELTNAIVRSPEFMAFLKSGQFLWTSWRDGHTHLYLYKFDARDPLASDATLARQLERGDYEVFDIKDVDESGGRVFFTANKDDPRQRQLYSVRLDGPDMQQISKEEGTHDTDFSPDHQHYVDDFSALMTPPQLSLCSVAKGCAPPFWESRSVAEYHLAKPEMLEFRADDGTVLYGSLLLPPNMQAGARIPLLTNPYGGPESMTVANEWGGNHFLFDQMLSREGIPVLHVDNRGMGARGKKFAAALQHNFGEIELKDQLAALDQILQKFPQLDANNIGWWGWSYGGYMTLYAMTHSARFHSGVSVAPVTDWRNYDSIYTERYMGLPQQNSTGYERSSPVHDAKNLHGDLLLVHGTGDDNVHFNNTIQMIEALIQAKQHFELMLYPGKTHGISGPVDQTDVYNRIKAHFERTLLDKPASEQVTK